MRANRVILTGGIATASFFKGLYVCVDLLLVNGQDRCVQKEASAWIAAVFFPTRGKAVEGAPMFGRLAFAVFKSAVFDEILRLCFLFRLFLRGQRGGEAKQYNKE